jgi:Epoxide hydrolase N terminus
VPEDINTDRRRFLRRAAMKQLERLTQQLTFRSGTIVVATMVVLALSLTSDRRIGLPVTASSVVGVSTTMAGAADTGTAIRPFRVNVPDADLADLRRRLLATRWPDKETVPDRSQGVQLERDGASGFGGIAGHSHQLAGDGAE